MVSKADNSCLAKVFHITVAVGSLKPLCFCVLLSSSLQGYWFCGNPIHLKLPQALYQDAGPVNPFGSHRHSREMSALITKTFRNK